VEEITPRHEYLARTDISLDLLQEARAVIRDALAVRPDHPRFHQHQYLLAFLDGDQKGMIKR
jgi:hypothetical protein